MPKRIGETQTDENAVIGGIAGKKVFVIDNAGNQVTSFGGSSTLYSYYKNASLASGYTFHGLTIPGSNPTIANFRLQRETLDTGLILYGNGTTALMHIWSSASLASIDYS